MGELLRSSLLAREGLEDGRAPACQAWRMGELLHCALLARAQRMGELLRSALLAREGPAAAPGRSGFQFPQVLETAL